MVSTQLALLLIIATTILGPVSVTARNIQEVEIVGPCVNNLCPHSYTCDNNECIRQKPKARLGAPSIGPCINAQCPVGHFCRGGENQCYPSA